MININFTDNNEIGERLVVKGKDLGEEETEMLIIIYGQSELRKQCGYKIELQKDYAELGEDLFEYFMLYITYRIKAESFKYDNETMSDIYIIFPETREILNFTIESYEVDFSEDIVSLAYCGTILYKAEMSDETFNLWSMIGFNNITKNMLEEHLRNLELIR